MTRDALAAELRDQADVLVCEKTGRIHLPQLGGLCREAATALSASCDNCQYRGHGWRDKEHYRKCMTHSLPCEELGNICGKHLPVTPVSRHEAMMKILRSACAICSCPEEGEYVTRCKHTAADEIDVDNIAQL